MKFNLPKHNYLGPGNPFPNGIPIDKDDKIAQQHDKEYSVARSQKHIIESDKKAALRFFVDAVENNNWHSAVGAAGLSIKTFIEQHTGKVLYPTGMKRHSKHPSEATPEKQIIRPQVPDSPQQPSSSAVGDPAQPGPSGAQIEPPPPQPYDVDVDMAAAGRGASSGSMGGGNVNHLFAGSVQEQQWQQRTYNKTYRWTLNSTLPSYRRAQNILYYKPGSLYTMPVHAISTYLSPQEFSDMINFPMVKTQHVSMRISSLGIRLPFTTNEVNSVTANASSQYPIVKMNDDFGKYHRIIMVPSEMENIREKMVGATPNTWGPTGNDYSTNIPNLSARTTSREYTMETILNLNEGTFDIAGVQPQTRDFANYYGTPNIHEFVEKSLNGTTNLGPVFEYSYKPKNNTLQCISTHNLRINRTTIPNSDAVNTTGMGKIQYQEFNGLGPNLDGRISKMDTMIPAPYQIYNNANVENCTAIDAGKEFENHRQTPFIIGMQFLRNEDDTLLVAKWEIIMETAITISVRTGTTGIYGVEPDLHISQVYFPSWAPGNLGNIGTGAVNPALGNQLRTTNDGTQSTLYWWNRPQTQIQDRTANQLTPYPGAPNGTLPTAATEGRKTQSTETRKK